MQEREQLRAVSKTLPFGDGSVMVWGGICGQQRTDLIVIDGNLTTHRYIKQVLRPVLLPFLQHQPRLLVQQDNASSCGASVLRRKQLYSPSL